MAASRTGTARNWVLLGCLIGFAASASADPFFKHVGDVMPAISGWSSTAAGPGVTAGPIDDGGVKAWNVADTSTQAGSTLTYLRTPTAAQISSAGTEGWVLRAFLRVVNSSSAPDAVDFSILAEYANGTQRYNLRWGAGANGANPVVQVGEIGSFTVQDADGGYHLYELAFDATAGSATLYVDGIATPLSGYVGEVAGAAGTRLIWGTGQSSSTGRAHYALVEWGTPRDTDQDGIPDAADLCASTPGGETVDAEGCSCTQKLCDDSNACTTDSCNAGTAECVFTALPGCTSCTSDADCDDAIFCNGTETCDPVLDCQAGTAPVLTDGVFCTVDICDEVADVVTHTASNTLCDDLLFCNGTETCDPVLDCQNGPLPAEDGVASTIDACDPEPTSAEICPPAFVADSYSLVNLGVDPVNSSLSWNFSTATDVNDSGQVVGYLQGAGAARAFLWDMNDGMGMLPALSESAETTASGINSRGQIVGGSGTAPAFWPNPTEIIDLGPLIDTRPCLSFLGTAFDINNLGQIAGNLRNLCFDDGPGFIWDPVDGVLARIDGSVQAINNRSQAVVAPGLDGCFVWDPADGLKMLPFFPGLPTQGIDCDPRSINDHGETVGAVEYPFPGIEAVIWNTSSGTIALLSSPDQVQLDSTGVDINEFGQVVGLNEGLYTIWDNGVPRSLNSLLDRSAKGWTVTDTRAINNAGQIVGRGMDPNGQSSAILLNPSCGRSLDISNISLNSVSKKCDDIFSVPQNGETSVLHRELSAHVSGSLSPLISDATVELSGPSGTALATLLSRGSTTSFDPPDLRLELGRETIEGLVSYPVSNLVRFGVRLASATSLGEMETFSLSRPALALWDASRLLEALGRFPCRDGGGDAWAALGTMEWIESKIDVLPRVNDISGEHGRNIGHDSHTHGTDLDIFHFVELLETPPGTEPSATANYNRLETLATMAMDDRFTPAEMQEARTEVVGFFVETRIGLATLLLDEPSGPANAVDTIFSMRGNRVPQAPNEPEILSETWADRALREGILVGGSTVLDLGIGRWSLEENLKRRVIPDTKHNNHFHVNLNEEAIGANLPLACDHVSGTPIPECSCTACTSVALPSHLAGTSTALDSDGDGINDGEDNCPYAANAEQVDSGSPGASFPDGIGNACQCGDVGGDGQVRIDDVVRIRRALAGLEPPLVEAIKCNVLGPVDVTDKDGNGLPDDCNEEDIASIRALLAKRDQQLGQYCFPASTEVALEILVLQDDGATSAGPGVSLLLNQDDVGVTDQGGRAAMQVRTGPNTVMALISNVAGAAHDVLVPPQGLGTIVLSMTGFGLREPSQLVVEGAYGGNIAVDPQTLALHFQTPHGIRLEVKFIEFVLFSPGSGGLSTVLTEAFMLSESGNILAADPLLIQSAIGSSGPGGTLRVSARRLNGANVESAVEMRILSAEDPGS